MQFALVDCNNFYVSCERAFNPSLENKPVVVLSNNDGCIISRSNEAKQLKIPMGAPFYQWKTFCEREQVRVFSSNYELYGDMSQRVMTMLKAFNEAMEIYSIDEAFMQLHDIVSFEDLFILRQNIKRCTGIPISIGVGKTKTLAKVANQIAKMRVKENVFIFTEHTTHHLTTFPVEKIWGIGYRLAKKLQVLNIHTAQKLQDADPKMIRSHFSVSVEKTVQELNGTSCIGLEKHQPRKQIVSSRSFGKKVTELNDLEEAISHYATIAAKKLRQQKSVASALYVYLHTNLFKDQQPQYGNAIAFPFPCPTADTRYFIRIAKKCLRQIYKKGYQYHKAGIMLLDISQANIKQQDLLMNVSDEKSERVMQALDKINANFGKNTIYLAAEGIKRDWMIRCDKRSARYTTKWEELPKVIC